MKELTLGELQLVSGGWFWITLPIFVGGGYKWGSDRANRDNKKDEKKEE
ncbi:hypothetical protein [uncultured Psychrosphaera sp.]|nr:hypothetical protein [uncultured Psychrosphaera sp.]